MSRATEATVTDRLTADHAEHKARETQRRTGTWEQLPNRDPSRPPWAPTRSPAPEPNPTRLAERIRRMLDRPRTGSELVERTRAELSGQPINWGVRINNWVPGSLATFGPDLLQAAAHTGSCRWCSALEQAANHNRQLPHASLAVLSPLLDLPCIRGPCRAWALDVIGRQAAAGRRDRRDRANRRSVAELTAGGVTPLPATWETWACPCPQHALGRKLVMERTRA